MRNGFELSGLPLKGILLNWKNPFIVYSNLFDYVHKGNFTQIKGSLINVVVKLYNNLHNKVERPSLLRNKITLYATAIR
jgi:hypothetical protein